MRRLILIALLGIMGALALLAGGIKNLFWGPIGTGLATASITLILESVITQWGQIRFALSTLRYWNQDVRVSVSYLFRIELDGKYLLVRGARYASQLQPVGGVYKFNERGESKLRKWGAVSDDHIPIDSVNGNDLRIRIKGRHLVSFKTWFASQKGRELSPWREFYEELIVTGVLPASEFPHISYEPVRNMITPIRFGERVGVPEMFIADIVELLPTPEQERALRAISPSANIKWATGEEIRRRGDRPGHPSADSIPVTAEWTL